MGISDYLIKQLVPFITGDDHPPKRSGKDLVNLFNQFGSRDIYDWGEGGLPEINKKNGLRPSRKEYVEARLRELSGKLEIRELLNAVINELENKETAIAELNNLLKPEKYNIVQYGTSYKIQGGIIDRSPPIMNEAHFQDIQDRILSALNSARASIRVVMAWFTNVTLFNKLVEKKNQGIDVHIAIYDDGVNKKHGVNISILPHTMIKRGKKGGLMHDKFCVIDNQIVLTGSYNWTNNAEYKNDENVTIQKDPSQATLYSEEFMRLIS